MFDSSSSGNILNFKLAGRIEITVTDYYTFFVRHLMYDKTISPPTTIISAGDDVDDGNGNDRDHHTPIIIILPRICR